MLLLKHYEILRSLMEHPQIQRMKEYGQHRNTDTYCHCCHVTLKSIRIVRSMGITADMESLVRGAMLHDFYLYDIKEKGLTAWQHGHRHPKTALRNAEELFELNWKEKNIIRSHMWPLHITHMPMCREALIVNVADKWCALEEMFFWSGKAHKGNFSEGRDMKNGKTESE